MKRRASVLCLLGMVIGAAPAAAAPPAGVPDAVVALGDSAISGEAGRWAGNTNNSPSRVDALGPTAYHDVPGGEAIRGCHRSKAAEIHIGGVESKNLACSGARTYTQPFESGEDFKPGIDFYDDGAGHIGQARALEQYAGTRRVRMVVVLIGANNFGFASVVQTCLVNWLTSPTWWKNYCHDDASVRNMFTDAYIAEQRNRVRDAYVNIRTAMANAGYAAGDYRLVAQTYSSPIPRGAGFRYRESGYTRQTIGGCGVWNRDADWADDTMVTTLNERVIRSAADELGVPVLDARRALAGHRLCENTVGLLEERGIANWTVPGAADQTEWVSQIRTVTTLVPPYQLQEDLHPSYWGQLALRNCVRQAYAQNRGGTCRSEGGMDGAEPNMALD
jgi:GDSL-like Lipase/Acylhydrolase family